MPALTNPRQERFCQLLKQGVSRYKAYPMAGYRKDTGAPYRLSEKARIKARLAEITRSIAMKTRVTVESISDQIDEDRAFAKALNNATVYHATSMAKAKLHGLIVDKKESGQPGDFAGLTTSEDVLAMVRSELGAEAADALAAAITRREEEQAKQTEIESASPAIEATRGPSEALN